MLLLLQLLLLSDDLLRIEILEELTLVIVLTGHHLDVGGEAVTRHGLHLQIRHNRRLNILL